MVRATVQRGSHGSIRRPLLPKIRHPCAGDAIISKTRWMGNRNNDADSILSGNSITVRQTVHVGDLENGFRSSRLAHRASSRRIYVLQPWKRCESGQKERVENLEMTSHGDHRASSGSPYKSRVQAGIAKRPEGPSKSPMQNACGRRTTSFGGFCVTLQTGFATLVRQTVCCSKDHDADQSTGV